MASAGQQLIEQGIQKGIDAAQPPELERMLLRATSAASTDEVLAVG